MTKSGSLEKKIDTLTNIVEKGFSALAEDITTMREDMSKLATKAELAAVHEQVNSIETQIRGINHVKLESRVCDLEEKVFGQVRG